MKFTAKRVREWRNGADGFFLWIADIQPRVLGNKGKYVVFQPEPFQVEIIRKLLAQKDDGSWQYTTLGISLPRRHSKTTIMALLCLWRFCLWANQNIVAMASTEKQIISTGFAQVRNIILNTPALLEQVGRENIQKYRIDLPKLQNSIRTVSTNVSGLYGEKITVGWCTEIHAMREEDPMQVLASSLGDTEGSWLLVDSTVDAIGGPLHRLEQLQESGEDPTVCVCRVEYTSLEEALEKSPPWIRRDWLKSRKAQLLPAVFGSQHLNQRSASSNNLFSVENIQRAQERLPLPMTLDDLNTIAQGRTFACGGGLDRAYFGSVHGDKTIWTSVAKVASADGGEPEYYVLNQKHILGSLGSGIKKAILFDNQEYSLKNTIIEAYNSQDVGTWAVEVGVTNEIIHATNTAQVPAFMELYRIVSEGRLHFSDKLKDLAREMETFIYELKGGQPHFGSDKFHDDRVYSLAWAIHSLREQELAAYVLRNLICNSKSTVAPFCYMRRGDLVLACSEDCPSHRKVAAMFLQHRSNRVESDIALPTFFKNMVKVEGARVFS